mmetsp:Transcript_8200/g.20109  ORF Transcript_8200/g.20109 Transcript_8200/m.20109 type:complete len:789 (-) Transcript_8200:158-2524(-)
MGEARLGEGPACDVWGLGLCVLWTLSETGDEALYRCVAASGKARARQVCWSLPSPLRVRLGPVLARCLDDDPAARPPVEEFLKALREAYLMVTGREPKPVKGDKICSKYFPMGELLPKLDHRMGRYHEVLLRDFQAASRHYSSATRSEVPAVSVDSHGRPVLFTDLVRTWIKCGGQTDIIQCCEFFVKRVRSVCNPLTADCILFDLACEFGTGETINTVAFFLSSCSARGGATGARRGAAGPSGAAARPGLGGYIPGFSNGILSLFHADPDRAVLIISSGLRLAAERGRLEVVAIITDSGIPAAFASAGRGRAGGKDGAGAEEKRRKGLVDILNHRGPDGSTAIALAARRGHKDIIVVLASKKADPFLANANMVAPLLRAAEGGSLECVALLLELKANLHSVERNGYNPLITAAQYGHADICRLLLDLQADPTLPKSDGGTALMVASFQGYHEVSRLLLDRRADPSAVALGGFSASDVTRSPSVRVLLAHHDGAENLKRLTDFRRAKLNEWTNRHQATKKGKKLKPSQKHRTFLELSQWMDRQCIKARCKMEVQRSAMKTPTPSANAIAGGSGADANETIEGKEFGSNSTGMNPGSNAFDENDENGTGANNAAYANGGAHGSGWGCAVLVCNRSKNYQVVVESYFKGGWRQSYILSPNQERLIRENQRCVVLDPDPACLGSVSNGRNKSKGGVDDSHLPPAIPGAVATQQAHAAAQAAGATSALPGGGAGGSLGAQGRLVAYLLSLRYKSCKSQKKGANDTDTDEAQKKRNARSRVGRGNRRKVGSKS